MGPRVILLPFALVLMMADTAAVAESRRPPWKFLALVPGISLDRHVEALYGRPAERRIVRFPDDGFAIEVWRYEHPERGLRRVLVSLKPGSRRITSVTADFERPMLQAEARRFFGAPRLEDGGPPEYPTFWFYTSQDGRFELLLWEAEPGQGFAHLRMAPCQPQAVLEGDTYKRIEKWCRLPERF